MYPRSIWSHMLWKEFRQIMPTVALLVVATIVLQGLVAWFHVRSNQPSFPQIFFLASLTPIFAAVVSTAVAIGSERQTGTWNWNSSLPISWKTALSSKFLAALAAMGLSALAAFAFTWPFWDYASGFERNHQVSPWIYAILSLLVAFEVWLLSTLLCLTIREPMVAIGLSILGLAAVHSGLYWVAMVETWPLNMTRFAWVLSGLNLLWLAALCIVTTAIFRKQWQQLEPSDSWGFAVVFSGWRGSTRDFEITKKSVETLRSSASTFGSLTWQTIRQSIVFYLVAATVLLGIVFIAFMKHWPPGCSMNFVFFIGAIAPWLGLQIFVTDRARNRYRFLADRGVGTVAYYWSRTLPAIVFLVAASLLGECVSPLDDFRFGTLVAFAMACLILGQLAGVCLRSSMLGFCFTYLLLVSALTLQSLTMLSLGNSWQIKDDIQWYYDFAWNGLSIFSLIGVFCIHLLISRWFREDRPKLGKWYSIILPLAIAVSLVAFVSAAIYTVPTGKDVFTGRQISQKKELDGFQVTKELLSEYNSLGLRSISAQQLTTVDVSGVDSREKRNPLLISLFEQIEMAPVVPAAGNSPSFTLDIYDANLIARAVLGQSLQYGDWGLANRAWTFQKKLSMIARDSQVPFIVDQALSEQLVLFGREPLEALEGIREWLSKEVPAASYEKFILENGARAEDDKSTQGNWIFGPLDVMKWVSLQRKLRLLNHQFPMVKSILERIENAKNMGELERIRSELVAIDDSLSPLSRNALGGYFLHRTDLLQVRERLDAPSSQTKGQSSKQQLQ